VLDKRRRFLRVNHVTFRETDSDINRSVSRSHAHIMWVPESGEYRVCDDRSAQGTSLIRGGRPVPVPPGSRGTRLQNGDEIVVGQARVKVRIAAE
jgi:predicted component of type VI protein secretion system